MPSTETHRKRRRSDRLKSHSSRSHKEHKEDEPDSAQSQLVERPATVEELRRARLDYIETPAAERQKRMKYEYIKTVPVKVKVSTSDKKSTRTYTASRSNAKADSKRRKRSHTEDVRGSDDEYVYQRRPSASRQSDPHGHTRETAVRNDTRGMGQESTMDRPRHRTTRRHTTPAKTISDNRPETVISSATRPQLRKSATATSESTRPTLDTDDAARRAKTAVSTARSTTTETKRNSSVFGGLFASKPSLPEKKVSCLTCGDDVSVSRTAKLPCSHRMCHSCLKRIFKLSVTDPAHMPPRCCTDQHIDLKHVDTLFSNEFKKNWNHKFKEYKAKNRIYCPRRGCGQWIQPKHIFIDKGRKIGRCSSCQTYVCGICSQKAHKSRDCPKDPTTKEFVEIAKKQGWQKCYSCSAMVELKEGCNHMTCRCTAEFCMVCAKKWKSCDCPWFSYNQVDVTGNPVRYQEEMDRRREQELRDEELARRMEILDVVDAANDRRGNRNGNEGMNVFNLRNVANGGGIMNATFVQMARDALTANYPQAGQVARGFLNGFFVPGAAAAAATAGNNNHNNGNGNQMNIPHDPAEPAAVAAVTMTPTGVPIVRHRYRRRNTVQVQDTADDDDQEETPRQREQSRRIRNWANGLPH